MVEAIRKAVGAHAARERCMKSVRVVVWLLEISVRDRGPGLSSDQCERAVEPFWRGVRHTSGSGLGLSIVAAIAKQHGGLLQLLPAPDGGLACRLTLPLAVADSS
ncbi:MULTISPECIES: sensor histidine kinase [Achromobacter]